MQIEPVELFGRAGRDFVIYGDEGLETFAARMWDDESTLHITWTDTIPRTIRRLWEARELAGGNDAVDTIVGQTSDRFREEIMTGQFEQARFERLLSRRLGGNWTMQVEPRLGSIPPTVNITITRSEG